MTQHKLFKSAYSNSYLWLFVGILLASAALILLASDYSRSYTAINPFPDYLTFVESPWALTIFVSLWICASWFLAYLQPHYYRIFLCFNYGIDVWAVGLIIAYGHAHEIATSYLLLYSALLVSGMTFIRQALAKIYIGRI